jgi:hypothetical protein
MRSIVAGDSGDSVGVVRVMDSPGPSSPEVVGHLRTDLPATHVAAADA